MKWFRGGLVFKAHGLMFHSILGWRVINKKKKKYLDGVEEGLGEGKERRLQRCRELRLLP